MIKVYDFMSMGKDKSSVIVLEKNNNNYWYDENGYGMFMVM